MHVKTGCAITMNILYVIFRHYSGQKKVPGKQKKIADFCSTTALD